MTTTIARIVVGVDGSPGADAALRWAVAEAALHGGHVDAVMGWGFLDQHHAVDDDASFDPHYNRDAALDALGRYVANAVDDDRASLVELDARCDLPARALLEAAADADVLVVGARGLGGFQGLLLGSVSQHCLHHAPCPVAIIRGEHRSGSIVAAVDGSATARRALQWAIAEAVARKAPLHVIHAWRVPHVGYDPHAAARLDARKLEHAARRQLATILEAEDTSGITDLQPAVGRGTPAAVILDAANDADADLIVIGTRGRGPMKRLLLGSTAAQVTQHATCPVVVVPPL